MSAPYGAAPALSSSRLGYHRRHGRLPASRGLGYMIQFNTNQFDTTGAVGGILVLMVCVMLFNGVLNRLERYVPRWRPRELQ